MPVFEQSAEVLRCPHIAEDRHLRKHHPSVRRKGDVGDCGGAPGRARPRVGGNHQFATIAGGDEISRCVERNRPDLVLLGKESVREIFFPETVIHPSVADADSPQPLAEADDSACAVILRERIERSLYIPLHVDPVNGAVLEVGDQELAEFAIITDIPQCRARVRECGEHRCLPRQPIYFVDSPRAGGAEHAGLPDVCGQAVHGRGGHIHIPRAVQRKAENLSQIARRPGRMVVHRRGPVLPQHRRRRRAQVQHAEHVIVRLDDDIRLVAHPSGEARNRAEARLQRKGQVLGGGGADSD